MFAPVKYQTSSKAICEHNKVKKEEGKMWATTINKHANQEQYKVKLVEWKSTTEHKWIHPSLSQSTTVTDKLQQDGEKEHSV